MIVDEASMVSLSLMARLLDAIRPGARLVLVGDPGQLASVEAGAVLADVAGPAADAPRMRAAAAAQLSRVSAMRRGARPRRHRDRRRHRHARPRPPLRRGDRRRGRRHPRAATPAATLAALAGGGDAVTWLPPEAATELVRPAPSAPPAR